MQSPQPNEPKAGQAGPAHHNKVYVARQPIFDRTGNVFGYELLYRRKPSETADFLNGSHATSEIIINSFIEFGIEQITNGKFAFINMTREFITGEIPLPLESQNIVLEILEDIEADPECLAGIRNLAGKGFTIALDDFVLHDGTRDLVPCANIVKVDVMALSKEELTAQVKGLKEFPVRLLAEKVETREEYDHCLELGFDYFQGYFFSKPMIIEGKQLPANQISLLEIIARLQSEDCDLKEIEEIILHDVGISFKLLRIINSSFYGLSAKVDSVQHALVLLGMSALKNWITLICFSMVENKPEELLALSLIRAKMCEALAEAMSCNQASAFTVGLFSMLDVLMDKSLEDLLGNLPLADEVKSALIKHEGRLGDLLQTVQGYEKGDWETVERIKNLERDINDIYLDALALSNQVLARLNQ